MAEISDDAPPPPSAAAVVGGNEVEVPGERPTKPGIKRLVLTVSVLVSFLAGLPFFLKSTEIYRSPLPFDAIDALSGQFRSHPPSLPCRFQAVFLRRSSHADRALADRFQSLISEEMGKRAAGSPRCGGCGNDFAVSVTIDSDAGCIRSDGIAGPKSCFWKCASVNFADLSGSDDAVDELLKSALRFGEECLEVGGGSVYTVVFVEREDIEGQPRVVVGKHRHAWITGKVQESDVVSLIGKVFVDLFMDRGNKRGELAKSRGDFMPVGSDGSITLSFSLLNADPSDWVYDWEFQEMSKIMMAPVIDALAPIAKISIESQVFYHTPKSANSHWDEKLNSYVFSITDLPFFVNSNEWHLDTSITAAGRSKVLQFAVYVPSARECPLLLRLPEGDMSKTNGFISPLWGGVVVWNPPNCSGSLQSKHLMRSTIPSQELRKIFQIFIAQIRMLFGLKSSYLEGTDMGKIIYLASERGFTQWELDVLYRYHTCFNLHSYATTLESLSKLVQSLPRMIVMDEIGKQVKYSLEAANLAQKNASLGAYDASACSSRQARALAEDAFFHPSIMSISYSSMEHYFAIYMPFFAPVSLHVLLAAIKELKRYRQEKAKYLAFTAKHAKSA